ncbi:MAG: hypothetical protein JWN25_2954 [Verrucomicrobiales bacterium]|nr:hypothetical protein [Verrucomicrobiales bacterium]
MFKFVCIALVFSFCVGCGSLKTLPSSPLPAATPFDSSVFARQAYLEAYAEGYAAHSHLNSTSFDSVHGTFPFARQLGFRAGYSQAEYDAAGQTRLPQSSGTESK